MKRPRMIIASIGLAALATPGIAPIAMSAGSPAPTTPTVPTGQYGY